MTNRRRDMECGAASTHSAIRCFAILKPGRLLFRWESPVSSFSFARRYLPGCAETRSHSVLTGVA
jgi:hypothetical protein